MTMVRNSKRAVFRSVARLLAGLVAATGLLGSAAADDQPARPNVLLIAVDDLNDWVGCLGGHPDAQTPHIDRLAGRGVLFTNAHCQAPVCTPSRASLMSGRLPSSTGLYFLQPGLRASPVLKQAVTLVEYFAQNGYRTMGVGKTYGGRDGDYYQEYGGSFGGFGPRPKQHLNYTAEGAHPLWDWGAYPDSDEKMPDHRIADWAIERLRRRYETPFFLAVGFYRPHVPMYAPQKWFDRHPLSRVHLPEVWEHDRDDLPAFAKDLTIGYPAPRHEWLVEHGQWKRAVQSYLACCTFVDHQIGRVLQALDSSPYRDRTVVVLFSDHGWHLGEKGRWAKRSLWEDSTRVPLIFAGPGIGGNRTCRRPVGLIDIYPTLCELCGLAVADFHEGTSLVPLLNNPEARWDRPVLCTFGPGNHAVRSQRWRYIHYADGSEELYDHETDPHEWHNLAGDPRYAEILAEHRRWLPKREHALFLDAKSAGLDAFLQAREHARRDGRLP